MRMVKNDFRMASEWLRRKQSGILTSCERPLESSTLVPGLFMNFLPGLRNEELINA